MVLCQQYDGIGIIYLFTILHSMTMNNSSKWRLELSHMINYSFTMCGNSNLIFELLSVQVTVSGMEL